ncbi:DUF397 domain-containing protein [Streptomyces olivaceiscleroticus]|uniref:DUF397 domain-containing protein n=1 Tax=Streptomyces olivaceiscleroticus TaxID=68245 RepID=A0ABP3K974_9ACTN
MNTELAWFKSSYSGPNGGDCVEVAVVPGTDTVHIRDSKEIRVHRLTVSRGSWAAFIAYTKAEAGVTKL